MFRSFNYYYCRKNVPKAIRMFQKNFHEYHKFQISEISGHSNWQNFDWPNHDTANRIIRRNESFGTSRFDESYHSAIRKHSRNIKFKMVRIDNFQNVRKTFKMFPNQSKKMSRCPRPIFYVSDLSKLSTNVGKILRMFNNFSENSFRMFPNSLECFKIIYIFSKIH